MAWRVQILGIRAEALLDFVKRAGCEPEMIRSPEAISEEADICIASGLYSIVPAEILGRPRLGTWGFHETALPHGRGWAPIHWTVLEGAKELSVSFFELTRRIDAGRLLGIETRPILRTMLLEDLRNIAMEMAGSLIERTLVPFLAGELVPRDQEGEPTINRRRTPEDSRLDLDRTLREQWDLIRVCDNDEYPAWIEVDGCRFVLKRYRDRSL